MKKEDDLAAEMRSMDREWRNHLMNEIRDIKQDCRNIRKNMNALKIKVAIISSMFGLASSALLHLKDKL